jgi:hypothetical protein
VRPKAPSASPAAIGGSQACFRASEPNRTKGIAPSPTAAESVIATDESTRASSSMATIRLMKSAPAPP